MSTSRKLLFAFAASAAPLTASAATVGPPAWLDVSAGGQSHRWEVREGKNEHGMPIWVIDQSSWKTDEFEITVSAELDPDPFIAYGIAVVDFGAPSAFGFSFGTPIVSVGTPNVVSGSLVGGLTDATGDGIALTPTLASGFVQEASVSAPSTSMGVDVGAALAAGPGAPGAFYAYGPYATGSIAGPGPGPWTFLTVTTGFSLSGGGDVAALTGFASIDPVAVPTPSAMAGGLALLGGLVAYRRRRGQ